MLRSYAEVMDFDLLKKKVNHDYLGEVRSHFHRVPLPSVPHYTDMLWCSIKLQKDLLICFCCNTMDSALLWGSAEVQIIILSNLLPMYLPMYLPMFF